MEGTLYFPGEGNGNPLQYSCLDSPMDGEPARQQSMGVTESDTTEQLSLKLYFACWYILFSFNLQHGGMKFLMSSCQYYCI